MLPRLANLGAGSVPRWSVPAHSHRRRHQQKSRPSSPRVAGANYARARMVSTMDELTRLTSMQALVSQLDDAATIARRMRDAAVYDYVADPAVNRRELCRQLGISSPRLYAILTNERDRRSADDDAQLGMFAELSEQESLHLWDEAVHAWQQAGEAGDIEDYFDLNALHVHRA